MHSASHRHAIVAGCGCHACGENEGDPGDLPHEGLHGLHLLLRAFPQCRAGKAIDNLEAPFPSFHEAQVGNLAEVLPAYLAFRTQGLPDDSRDVVACRGKDSRESDQNEEDQEACMHLEDRTFLAAERA